MCGGDKNCSCGCSGGKTTIYKSNCGCRKNKCNCENIDFDDNWTFNHNSCKKGGCNRNFGGCGCCGNGGFYNPSAFDPLDVWASSSGCCSGNGWGWGSGCGCHKNKCCDKKDDFVIKCTKFKYNDGCSRGSYQVCKRVYNNNLRNDDSDSDDNFDD